MPNTTSPRTIRCAKCGQTASGVFPNGISLAKNTPGWAAWLDSSCTSVALCPLHSGPVIAAVDLLHSAIGEITGQGLAVWGFTAGEPLEGASRVEVSVAATCQICGKTWTTGVDGCTDPLAAATKCSEQGEPPKPAWFDRITEKGAYAFGAYGVRGILESETPCLGRWVIQNKYGEHEWAWLCSVGTLLYSKRQYEDADYPSILPIAAVDPERGFDLCRCVKPNDATRAYWLRIATEHYGIDNPAMPEALKG